MSMPVSTVDRKGSMTIIFAIVGGVIAALTGLPLWPMVILGAVCGWFIG